jgi:hypothetical protein
MNERNLIKKEFVKQILQEEGAELHDNQGKAIAKLLNFHSNRLYEDRNVEVTGGDDMDGKLTLTVPARNRFLDIKPKAAFTQNKYTHWRKRRRTKAFPIYNRFVFGHYYTIAWRLMYGLTEDVAAGIKEQFESINNG